MPLCIIRLFQNAGYRIFWRSIVVIPRANGATSSVDTFSFVVAGCGQMKTVVKTRPGKVCFSVEPVQTCAPGCMGDSNKDEEDYMFVKRVPFHCIPEDSSLASRLLEDAESRVLTEIRQKPANDWFALPNADRCNVSGGPIRRVAYARGEIY